MSGVGFRDQSESFSASHPSLLMLKFLPNSDRTMNDFSVIINIITIIQSSSLISYLLVFSKLYLMDMKSLLIILYYGKIRNSQSYVIIFAMDFFATDLKSNKAV